MKSNLLLLIFISFILCCGTNNTSGPNKPVITVWIHGTRLTPEFVAYNFFHCLPGLNPAISLDKKFHLRSLAELLCAHDPENYHLESFYIFGWNGKLSSEERRRAGLVLYYQLLDLVNDYKNIHGTAPYVRIITHSHGGNVALHFAEFVTDSSVNIDELILLACPVQKLTSNFIYRSCFKKIYSFYTTKDLLQVLDPQGLHIFYQNHSFFPLFSGRMFPDHPSLKQAQITYNKRSLWHIEFLFAKFVGMLPKLITQIEDSSDKIVTINVN